MKSLAGLRVAAFAWLTLAGVRAEPLSSPRQIDGLGLWLTAQDLAANLAEGQPVLRWPDRSGNGYDAIYEPRVPQTELRAGLHRPPEFKAKAVAGRAAVAFKAEDRQTLLLNRAAHALGQRINGFSAVFLLRPELNYGPAPAADVEWSDDRYLFITHLSDYSTRFSVQVMAGTGEVRVVSRPEPKIMLDRTSSFSEGHRLALTSGVWHRLAITVDYQSKRVRIFIDGESVVRALRADTPDRFEDVPSPIAGIGSDTLGAWLTCDLAEMMCYQRALNLNEIEALDGYLCAAYDLGRKP